MWIRGVAYVLLALLLAEVSMFEVRQLEPLERFSEFGYVELGQSVLLAAMVLILFIAVLRSPRPEPMLQCFAIGFAILLVRENDQVLELFLPHGVWKWPALALLIWLAVTFFRHRLAVLESLRNLSRTPAFGVLLAGFTALVFSRLFGRGTLWETLMGDAFLRDVKNAAEEGVELFALGLIAAGVVELLIQRRQADDGRSAA